MNLFELFLLGLYVFVVGMAYVLGGMPLMLVVAFAVCCLLAWWGHRLRIGNDRAGR